MNIQCCICHDHVRVPVRFTCFPCKTQPGKPSCNSITRVCLLCAREYLQLNKKRSDRTTHRKCLTCPAQVRCSTLCAINSYEKDFLMMTHDKREDYKCFHDDCSFKGTQNGLDHHIQTECPYRIISCQYCKLYYQAMEETTHITTCPEYSCCFYCKKYIPKQEERRHYKEHNLQNCRYCYKWVHNDVYIQHKNTCPEKPYECVYCHKNFQRKHIYDHLVEHVDLFSKIISQNNHTNNELLRMIPVLLHECKKYQR